MGQLVLLGALRHADGREMKVSGKHYFVYRGGGEVQSACHG